MPNQNVQTPQQFVMKNATDLQTSPDSIATVPSTLTPSRTLPNAPASDIYYLSRREYAIIGVNHLQPLLQK